MIAVYKIVSFLFITLICQESSRIIQFRDEISNILYVKEKKISRIVKVIHWPVALTKKTQPTRDDGVFVALATRLIKLAAVYRCTID